MKVALMLSSDNQWLRKYKVTDSTSVALRIVLLLRGLWSFMFFPVPSFVEISFHNPTAKVYDLSMHSLPEFDGNESIHFKRILADKTHI